MPMTTRRDRAADTPRDDRRSPTDPGPSPRPDEHEAGRALQERVARCVATLVYYHKDGGSWAASGLLHAEAAGFTAWAASSGPGAELEVRVLASIEGELLA